ncbi:MAG TPA: mechanosensitive ion channel family protein [Bryobacteraceae bacterium]|jgi:small-conductance mechanosensitive channel|nr:mechanosensitive ion channel family protein [Bryobacteraceae bacterium]
MRYLQRLLDRNPAELIWPMVVFLLTVALGWVGRWLILKALRSWARRTGSRGGSTVIDVLAQPLRIWILILGAHLALQSSSMPASYADRGTEILYFLWMISITLMGMRLAGSLVLNYGDQVPGALPVTTLSRNLAQIGVLILGIVVALDHYNYSIKTLLTALGIGGLAVALALQDTLSNLFAGFYVAVARQIRLGDYVKLNSGEEGYVSDIGWRSTSIRSLGSNMIIVPNAKLAQAIVTNYYLPEKRMSASFEVGVSYRSDLDKVEQMLLEIAQAGARDIPGLLADPAPSVSFDPGFGDSSLRYTVSFTVAEFASQFSVRNELKRRVFRRFRQDSIEIPFPTRTVYVENDGKSLEGPPAQ